MSKLLLVKYGEITLKGKNKNMFINKVISNTKNALWGIKFEIIREFNRFLINLKNDDELEKAIAAITKVFGLYNVSIIDTVPSKINDIVNKAIDQVGIELKERKVNTFKVDVKRTWKAFPGVSTELAGDIGWEIGEVYKDLKVDLKNPDLTVYIEILSNHTMIYTKKITCLKGMPVGTAGKVGLLLSGGIDSPVAGYLAQKRGCYLNCIYFHSPPHTSMKAKEKVLKLAEKLKDYQGRIKVMVVNFTESQLMLKKLTKQEYFVVLGRRVMMRIANKLAKKHDFKAFVTGENLGQVASQTLENLHCTNTIADLPIIRPLISYDKEETIEIARKIGTFDISILPYDDCCTLFLPPNPNIKSRIEDLELEEQNVNIEEIVNRAVDTVEIIRL
ncbi:MAG: tRNA 4-thiouridine(8) synthase ThiI [Candidatus Delongbacteria bacterium]|nr:tRNA 4-thiouridine(8) synthase ThiI [Candidatus Delongbacteria bacterium]MBN2833533.1 tRNA 4-thiouridine(8) synthase ThiI [Candidatus Delongbacteria bacterium]